MSVYKSEQATYLDRALHSIWTDQILKPDQIVLIKDGPLGDDLNEVVEKWRKNIPDVLDIIINLENIGLTKSLNKGLNYITGDYIARMDSDDISTPERFKLQKDFLDNNPDVYVVGGSIIEFDTNHENLGIRKFPLDNPSVLKYIFKASPLAHPTVMMRKKLFGNGIRYNERYRTSQDIALWFDVLKTGYKISNINDVTLRFRRAGDVFKRRSRDKAYNELKIYFNGILDLYGLFTWKYIYPIARYCFRLMPVPIVRFIYGTKLRTKLLQ